MRKSKIYNYKYTKIILILAYFAVGLVILYNVDLRYAALINCILFFLDNKLIQKIKQNEE